MVTDKIRVGDIYESNSCGLFKVVSIETLKKVTVEFLNTGYTVVVQVGQIRLGTIRDRFKKDAKTSAFLGESSIVDDNGDILREHTMWANMLSRCGNVQGNSPTYKDCGVSDNFKHFSYFKEWCNKQIGFDREDWHLDKDILIKGNKLYSEDTCCFIPREINNLLTMRKRFRGNDCPVGVHWSNSKNRYVAQVSVSGGKRKHLGCFTNAQEAFLVYKQAKESYIKEVAEKWKDQIDPRVYEALVSWNVEEGD